MTGLQRAACLIGSAAALVLSASGCDPYTYFNVHVTIDPVIDKDTVNNPRQQISSCILYVFAGDQELDPNSPCAAYLSDGYKQIEEGEDLKRLGTVDACKAPITPLDVETLYYSTSRSSGILMFLVSMKALSGDVTVQCCSHDANVNPGQVLTVELVAEPCTTSPCENTNDTTSFP